MFSSSSPELPDPCAALLRCTMPGEQSCSSTPRVRSEIDRARRPAGSWPQAAHCRGQAAPRRSRGFQRAQEAGKGRERGEKRAGRGADRARTAAGDLAESCVRLGASRGRVSGRERRRPRSRSRRGERLLFFPQRPSIPDVHELTICPLSIFFVTPTACGARPWGRRHDGRPHGAAAAVCAKD